MPWKVVAKLRGSHGIKYSVANAYKRNGIPRYRYIGSKSTANSWLNKENLTLGTTPISLANSDSGLLEVKKILSAISYGGVAVHISMRSNYQAK